MKTTIDLPDALAREARRVATEEGVTLRELVVDGLRAELQRRAQVPETVRFVLRTVPGNGLRPGVAPSSLTERAYDLP